MNQKPNNSLKLVKKFIQFAKQKKVINFQDFKKHLPNHVYSSSKFFKILEVLEKYGVEIEKDEEKKIPASNNKKVQYDNLYMKEMSRYSLLSAEEEILLVKLLEENEVIVLEEIVKTKHFFAYLVNTYWAKYRRKYRKKYGKKYHKVHLKKLILKKLIKSIQKNKLLNIKKEFKIPRSDLIKIARKVMENAEIAEKKRRLAKAIRKIEELQEKLINSNLRLVLSIAKKYARKNSNLFDLIQEGNLGLIKAVEMFYYRKGIRFAAYAKWWIKQSIVKSLYENSHYIKIPLHFIEAIKKLEDYINTYVQENKEYPSLEFMMKATNFSKKKIIRILQIIAKPLSLDTPMFYKDSMVELKDTIKDVKCIGPYKDFLNSVMFKDIKQLLSGLSEKERKIIIKRYGLEDGVQRTLDEVGYFFNLTRERIRQIEKKAFEKLKVPSKVSMYKKLLEGDSV